ncbi:MAG TPA: lipid II flippase MurJ [Actinocrinis sp.]
MPDHVAPLPSVDDPLVQPIAPVGALDRATAGPEAGGGLRAHGMRGVAGGAALIAAVTVLSRMVGFLRTLTFSHTVGTQALADAYNTANQIPNTIFDIVAGGALASVAVPLLAGPFSRGERHEAEAITSALLTWAMGVLLPLSLVGMAISGPLGDLLGGDHPPLGVYGATVGRFLVMFLPQIPLYGVAVVLSATLQADRRFLAPALAPLLSSLVVVTTYLAFGELDPKAAGGDLSGLGHGSELFLGLGTTLGVATLALSLLPALRRSGLHLRPRLRFPPGVAHRARGLAAAGVATLAAQNVATIGIVLLTSHTHATDGSLTVYTFSWAVYVLPYAVLAVPIATTAFTDLSARSDEGDADGYSTGVAATSRAVVIAACLGSALLAATAWPMSYLFISAPGGPRPSMMAYGLLAFALGVPGYAAIAHLGRALYAGGQGRAAATATVIGWLAVLSADCLLVWIFPPGQAVAAFGLGNAVGMTLAGVLLLVAVHRHAGSGAFTGLPRAAAVGAIAAAAAGAAGWLTAGGIGPTSATFAIPVAVLCATIAIVVFAVILLALDDGDMWPLLLHSLRGMRLRRVALRIYRWRR